MKKFLVFLLFNVSFFYLASAKDSLTVDIKLDKSWCNSVTSDIASWIEGYQMGADLLSVYLNVTRYEFEDFLDINNTDVLTLRLFWKSNTGNQIRKEGDYILDSTQPDFDVRNWTAIHQPADLAGGYYVAQVLVGENTCSEFIPIQMVEENTEEEENLPIELPAYNCGETYEYKVPENTTLISASPGDIFFIGGFPLLLETVSGGNGTFSGTGTIPLPFDRKVVSVEFTDITVNDEGKIKGGQVIAMSDDLSNYPDFNPDTDIYTIGEDICLEAPETPGFENGGIDESGLNPRGFDPFTGVHGETGTNFDEYGFDMNGNYEDGTLYNQCGCSVEGLTASNEVCDISCGPNPEAEEFADDIENSLPTQTITFIDLLITENEGVLANLPCAQIRSDMLSLNQTLQYDPVFIFGEDNKYINTDMHLQFSQRPQSLPVTISSRDEDAISLENKHVELYDCDKQQYAVNAYIATLNLLKEQDQMDAFIAATLIKIRNWPEYMLNLMSDPAKFDTWLVGEIGEYMMENSGLDHSYHNLFVDHQDAKEELLENKLKSIFDLNDRGLHHDIASITSDIAFDDAFTLEDASFLFRQGYQKIDGVDRAYYLEELAKRQSYVVSDAVSNLLPIVVDKTVGNKTYTIYLDQIVFSTTGASVNAFLIITDPESGKRIVFKGLNIGFGPTGLQGESRLSLESEVQIRLNNAAMLVLNPTGETFVEWDCDGFSSMGIDAGIEFCRNFITPLDPITLAPLADEDERYRFDIVTVIDSWLEFNLTLPGGDPFAVTRYEDIKWQFSNVILDFSSSSTADFEPPEGFASPFFDGSQMSDLWKGVYIESLSVQFPNQFSSSSNPITASANNVLIDGNGFSGGLSVQNLVTINNGNLGGWPFSIDNFHLKILNNQYAGAGMGGLVNVPIFTENLSYTASVFPNNEYHFSVETQSDLTADVFVASVTLEENSAIDVSYVDGEFIAVATLHGTMDINTGNNADANFSVGLPTVSFQDFEISNQPNYFNAGSWGVDIDSSGIGIGLNGFGLKVYGIQPCNPSALGPLESALEIDVEVKLVDAEKVGLGGRGRVCIVGKMDIHPTTQRQSWDFDRIDLQSLIVDGHFPGVEKLYGEIRWYHEDPDFGEGFRGAIELELSKIGVGVQAVGQFGKLNNGHKYFFVDAFAKLGALSPSIGVMKFTGFGGGVSYGMRIDQTNPSSFENAPDSQAGITLPPLGTALSGTVYTPDPGYGLGIKAAVSLATQQEDIFNGTVGLTFEFNSNESLREITLFGSGQFLKGYSYNIAPDITNGDIADNKPKPASVDAALSVYVSLNINFAEGSLDGDLISYLNAGLVTGDPNNDGRFVTANLHFSNDDWYIYIGTPSEPAAIHFNLPFIGGGLSATAYFDIGTNVPPMPPLPENVREIAYKVNTNSSLRQSGAGFVFGAALDLHARASIGIASAEVKAGVGFDLSLRRYNNLVCSESGDPVGIDGWYATGQMWAYASGTLEVFGVSILEAGVAAVLQARLPNPFFAQATVGIRVKIGPFKARKSLSISFGDDCTLVSNDPDDLVGIDVIPYIDPTHGGAEIETSSIITAVTTVVLNRVIEVNPPQGQGDPKEYRVTLQDPVLQDENGLNIPYKHYYDSNNSQINVIPNSYLPGGQFITAILTVEIKEGNQHIAFQSDTTIFRTADDLNVIPEKNIVYSYPVMGMNNFYPGENPARQGFIKMDRYQHNIVDQITANAFIRFTDRDNNIKETYVDFDYLNNTIIFDVEDELLTNGVLYQMELVRYTVPHTIADDNSNGGTSIFSSTNETNTTSPVYRLSSGGLLQLAIQGSLGTLPPPVISADNSTGTENHLSEEVFYTTYFRVSNYNTLSDKINNISDNTTDEWNIRSVTGEAFDRIEVEGIREMDPLINVISRLNPEHAYLLNNELYNYFPVTSDPPPTEGPICNGRILHYNSIGDDTNYLNYAGIKGPLSAPLREEQFFNTLGTINLASSQSFVNDMEKEMLNDILSMSGNLNGCIMAALEIYDDEPGSHPGLVPPGVTLNHQNIEDYYPYTKLADEYDDRILRWLYTSSFSSSPISDIFPLAPSAPYSVDVVYNLPDGTTTSINTINFQK